MWHCQAFCTIKFKAFSADQPKKSSSSTFIGIMLTALHFSFHFVWFVRMLMAWKFLTTQFNPNKCRCCSNVYKYDERVTGEKWKRQHIDDILESAMAQWTPADVDVYVCVCVWKVKYYRNHGISCVIFFFFDIKSNAFSTKSVGNSSMIFGYVQRYIYVVNMHLA